MSFLTSHADLIALVGDEVPELLANPFTTDIEVDRYLDECVMRADVARAKVGTPGLPLKVRAQAIREHLMLWGRCVAVSDVAFRLGLVTADQFRRNHERLTETVPSSSQIESMQRIRTADHARGYMDTHLTAVLAKRSVAVRATTTEGQQLAFKAWLSRLGQVLEANGLFLRQRVYETRRYEHYLDAAMRSVIPTVSA